MDSYEIQIFQTRHLNISPDILKSRCNPCKKNQTLAFKPLVMTLDRSEKIIVGILASACLLMHLITNLTGAYGFFRDELYYIACSDHLAFGYVDQPPFSIYILKLSRLIFGDSLTAIRLVPTLAHTATIVVTALIVKQMGGKTYAVFIGCLGVFASLIHVGMSLIFSMNAIDIFLWALATY
jgi:4-amino-4-deoxy-L-arabinose transferase-like glycosyltransferase